MTFLLNLPQPKHFKWLPESERNATLRTGYHIAKALLEDVIQASIIIGKLLVQIVDSVARHPHIIIVADLLHDVKG